MTSAPKTYAEIQADKLRLQREHEALRVNILHLLNQLQAVERAYRNALDEEKEYYEDVR